MGTIVVRSSTASLIALSKRTEMIFDLVGQRVRETAGVEFCVLVFALG